MIESWRFINGERIMFPTSSADAIWLGWHKVVFDYDGNVLQDYWVNGNEEFSNWLKENVADRAYWVSMDRIYFYRESDAAMFTLRWV